MSELRYRLEFELGNAALMSYRALIRYDFGIRNQVPAW